MAARHRFLGMRFASLRCAFVISALVFLVLMGIAVGLTNLYGQHEKTLALRSVQDGLTADLEHLRIQGDAVAENILVKQYLLEEAPDKILPVLAEERERREIGLMGVANKEGVIISRTLSTANRGENAFLVSPQGRAVAEGKRPASIEVSSFDPKQVLMTTGRPIIIGTSTIGALFANYLLDDSYSARFKVLHLFDGVHVAFYTKEFGLYGMSFHNEIEHSVLNSYFNVDSDWIKRGKTGDIIKFDSGIYYRVENIVFPGLEHSPGGVLVFVPYYGYGWGIRAFIVFVTVILFLLLAYHAHRATRKEQRNRYYYWSSISAFLLLIVFIYTVNHAVFVKYVSLKRIPYILYNSTLRLQPDAGVFDRDFDRPISILVDTGDESINAVSVHISFNPSVVRIEDIDIEHSICSNILEKTIDIANKEIRISCIVTSPGFSGSQGNLADIVAHPLVAGQFGLEFSDTTQVLANDGLGTNVLRQTRNGSYTVVPPIKDTVARVSAGTEIVQDGTPIVFSPTHSNTSRWYNVPNIEFVWMPIAGDGYIYAFDEATSTIPRTGIRVANPKVTITAPSDGIFYFHVAAISGDRVGPTRHYKVMIDTTPPMDVSIRASQDAAKMGDVVRFEFSAQDKMSGLQNTMYIDIDNGTFLPVGRQTYVPFVDIGTIPMRLRVYDKAGNFTEKEKVVRVSGTILQSILHAR
jgi:hypothetical protein